MRLVLYCRKRPFIFSTVWTVAVFDVVPGFRVEMESSDQRLPVEEVLCFLKDANVTHITVIKEEKRG